MAPEPANDNAKLRGHYIMAALCLILAGGACVALAYSVNEALCRSHGW